MPEKEIRRIQNTKTPKLSIIIPTRDADRDGLLPQLLEELKNQSFTEWEVFVVIGDKRQGRAINTGVKNAKADIIATMDDDTILAHKDAVKNCYDELLKDKTIGMIGAACGIPEDSSAFMKKAMIQIPRRFFPKQDKTIDSDMVQHPLLMMPKKIFEEIGGEDEEIIRGLDPLLRYKTRQAGYRVCIAANSLIYHALPEGLWKVMKMYFRNGRGSAFARKHYPDKVFELTDGYQENQFQEKKTFIVRVFRKCISLSKSFLTLQYIWFLANISYTCGYFWETFFSQSE